MRLCHTRQNCLAVSVFKICKLLRRAIFAKRLFAPSLVTLVRADQFRLPDDLTLHRVFEFSPGYMAEIGQDLVQRIQFVKVAVSADRWTGPSESRAFPVIQSFSHSQSN
jgi:hypothetical protein